MSNDKMREAFEENLPFGFSAKNSDGEYIDNETSVWFDEFSRGWQAALTQQPSAQVLDEWREAAQLFVNWVERGQRRSTSAYAKFKRLLAAPSIAEKPNNGRPEAPPERLRLAMQHGAMSFENADKVLAERGAAPSIAKNEEADTAKD